MAVQKILTVCGMKVEVWEQSFRVEGMSNTVWFGPNMTDAHIRELVMSVYETGDE